MASAWIVASVMVSILSVVASDPCVPPGEFLSGSSGVFSSPNFPNNFPTNSNCTWNITVPAGKIIKVTFFNFTLEPNQGSACIGEPAGSRVFITNVASDNGRHDFQICGQDLPDPVYSVGNSMFVRLGSLSNVNSGFNASYEAIDEKLLCPAGINLTETSGVITSPFYPRMYPDNQNCSWQITAHQGNRVKLEIAVTLNIQRCGSQQYECSCDYLLVQHGFSADPNGNKKICGAPGQTKTYYSTFETLKVLFVSDDKGSKQYDGFEAIYTQIDYTPPICPAEAIPLSGNGTLSSPNHPKGNYPASRNCSWNITVPSDKKVKFEFTYFALGSCETCSSDKCTYVELYDGASASSPSLGRFCSGSVLEGRVSSGNQMFVTFRSGSSLDRGFEAQYSAFTEICPAEAIPLSGNGTLSSPNHPKGNYPASRKCSWIITVACDKQVKFEFTYFALGSCENCSSDKCTYVELYDGASASSPSLGRFCSGSDLEHRVSSGNQMFVTFRSGSSLDRGFEAQYSAFTEICPAEAIPLSGNGTLSSPNHPKGNYPASRKCSWIITVACDKQVKFEFTYFALGSCENCSSDKCTYVELYDGASASSPSLGRFCSGSDLEHRVSSGNQMFVTFRSGSSLDRGFEAKYLFTDRPTTTTTTTSTKTTPHNGSKLSPLWIAIIVLLVMVVLLVIVIIYICYYMKNQKTGDCQNASIKMEEVEHF